VSDSILTPAHLLLLPLDNKKLVNFLNFNDIGSTTLKESVAFKKIKTISKTFTSNLVTSPTSLNLKYKKINQTYLTDTSFLTSNNYGLVRQHNYLTSKSNLTKTNIMLDKKSFNQFLINNSLKNSQTLNKISFNQNLLNIQTKLNQNLPITNLSILALNLKTSKNPIPTLLLENYKTIFTSLNNNSDGRFFSYPLRKLFNGYTFTLKLLSKNFLTNTLTFETAQTLDHNKNKFLNSHQVKKILTLNSPNQNIASPDQNLRQYKNLSTNKTTFNLTGKLSFTPNGVLGQFETLYYNLRSHGINTNLVYKLNANQLNLTTPYPPIFTSTNVFHSSLNYDSSTKIIEVFKKFPSDSSLNTHFYDVRQTNNVSLLKGKRDGVPEFLNRSY
jgi:hypothetical protein